MQVLDEQLFREKTTEFLATDYASSSRDCNLIVLMSLVCGLGAHYLWTDPTARDSMPILDYIRKEAIQATDAGFFRVIAKPSLAAIQIAVLLGSFHLFNGSPYLGFGILGSGVKCAQAIGLHRQSRHPIMDSGAEQGPCRIWWAPEIFDKYAVAVSEQCSS